MRQAKDPRKPHRLDYLVACAVKRLDDSRCPKCGVLAWHAFSTDNRIEFECEDMKCQSCAHKEKVEKDQKEPEPGVTKVVKAKNVFEGEPLPGIKDFYQRMAQEAEVKARHEAERKAA